MINQVLCQDMEDIFSRNIDWERLNGKTVLLTGAYGMLASYIVYFLLYLKSERGIDVNLVAAVRNKDKFYAKFSDAPHAQDVKLVISDLSSEISVDGNIDYIIHAASLASPQYYSVCPVDVLSPNVFGTFNLLKLAKEKKSESFLLFSSCDAYGSVVTDSNMVDETMFGAMDALDIHNCYSESKRMAETICKAFYVQYQVPVKIARIAHTYAPTMDIEHDPRVFASFVKNIVDGKNIEMKSNGSGKRPFCYITDAVAAYFKILLDGKDGEAYNVCNTDQFVSIKDLAECLVNLFPERGLRVIRVERDKSEKYTENVLLAGKENNFSNAKLKSIGWEPKIDINEGFKRVVRYIEEKHE